MYLSMYVLQVFRIQSVNKSHSTGLLYSACTSDRSAHIAHSPVLVYLTTELHNNATVVRESRDRDFHIQPYWIWYFDKRRLLSSPLSFKQTSTLQAHFTLQLIHPWAKMKQIQSPTITTTHIENRPNKMFVGSLVLKVCVLSGLIFLSRISSNFANVPSSTFPLQTIDFDSNAAQGECYYAIICTVIILGHEVFRFHNS